jgi:hypothetical protein
MPIKKAWISMEMEDMSFLRNIKIVHYPTHTTSVLQPPDMGITKWCRQLHSKHPVQKALYLIYYRQDAELEISVLTVIHFTVGA